MMYILCFGIAWVSVVFVIFLLFFNIKIALILGSVITIIIFAYLIIKGKICEKYKIPQLIEQMETEHKVILHSMACLLKNQECASDKEKKEGKIGILFLLEQRIYFQEVNTWTPYEWSTLYYDITEIQKDETHPKMIKIYLTNGGCKGFAVEQREIWMKKIQELMDESVEKE